MSEKFIFFIWSKRIDPKYFAILREKTFVQTFVRCTQHCTAPTRTEIGKFDPKSDPSPPEFEMTFLEIGCVWEIYFLVGRAVRGFKSGFLEFGNTANHYSWNWQFKIVKNKLPLLLGFIKNMAVGEVLLLAFLR